MDNQHNQFSDFDDSPVLHDSGAACAFCQCRLVRLVAGDSSMTGGQAGHQTLCACCGARGPVCQDRNEAMAAWGYVMGYLRRSLMASMGPSPVPRIDKRVPSWLADPRVGLIKTRVFPENRIAGS